MKPSILVISRETTIQPIVSIRESLKDVRLIVLVGAAVDPAVMTGADGFAVAAACGRITDSTIQINSIRDEYRMKREETYPDRQCHNCHILRSGLRFSSIDLKQN